MQLKTQNPQNPSLKSESSCASQTIVLDLFKIFAKIVNLYDNSPASRLNSNGNKHHQNALDLLNNNIMKIEPWPTSTQISIQKPIQFGFHPGSREMEMMKDPLCWQVGYLAHQNPITLKPNRKHLQLYGASNSLTYTSTVHHSLLSLTTNRLSVSSTARCERWCLRLKGYHFTVEYRPWENNAGCCGTP